MLDYAARLRVGLSYFNNFKDIVPTRRMLSWHVALIR